MSRSLIRIQLGKAISTDGTNGNGVQRTLVSSSTGDFTACCWLYLSGTPSATKTLIKNGQTGTGNGGWSFNITSASKLNLSDPGGAWGGTASTALSNTTWYFVAFIRSGTSTQMYVNAVADGSAVSGSFNSPEVDTTISCTHNTSSGLYTNVLNGYIDDARIYTRAISTAELTQLYNYGIYNDSNHLDISSSNLILWYKLDESTGATTVADSSSSANTGTVVGSPTFVTGTVYIANIPARTAVSSPARSVAGTRTLAS